MPAATVSNTGANVDIVAKQGARLYLSITYRDPAGDVVDLSTYTATLLVRTSRGTTATSLLSVAPTTAATAPNIVIDVPFATMAAMTQSGVYDLDIIDGSSRPKPIWYGNFHLVKEV